jgi:hypothetical protein
MKPTAASSLATVFALWTLAAQPVTAQDVLGAEYAALKAEHDAKVNRAAQAPYDAGVADLNAKYNAGLDREFAAAQQSGKLDEALALKGEKESIAKGEGVPTSDADGTPAALKKLRATYRAALARIDSEREKRLQPLQTAFAASLDALVRELTKQGKLETAAAVKQERELLASSVSGAAGRRTESLLAAENRKKWKEAGGEWKFGDGTLLGRGNSQIDYRASISPPFTLEFKMTVLEGMRPRVKIGDLVFANEGYQKTLGLYPGGKETLFPYELNKKYKITLRVARDHVELLVDDTPVSRVAGMKDRPEAIAFRAGDNWSKGSVEFSDITLSH